MTSRFPTRAAAVATVALFVALPFATPAAGVTTVDLACFTTSESNRRIHVDAGCSLPGATSYRWSWGDGTSTTTSSETASHVYKDRATRTITLRATYVAVSDSTSRTVTPGLSDYWLAREWAPVFYQDTDTTDYSADEIARFDFDGDWRGSDNWDDEPAWLHRAYVYYYIIESSTHYFIGYMVFHPRDWSEGKNNPDNSEHENDMEGALVMAYKSAGTGIDYFEAVMTMAHNHFYVYEDTSKWPSYLVSASSSYPHGSTKDVDFYATDHVKLGIEAKGHGIYRSDEVYNGDFNGHGIIYYPGASAEIPSGSNDRSVTYTVTPIDPLWDKRYDYSSSGPYSSYGIFRGDKSGGCGAGVTITCKENAARPPWGMYEKDDVSASLGKWWTNPGYLFDRYLNGHQTISTSYSYKSFL